MIRARLLRIAAVCLALPLALAGCGAVGAIQRSGTQGAFSDNNSAIGIKARMNRADGFYLSGVDVEVTDGVVLLSGEAPRPEDRVEAERIAWTGENVRQVANEIAVGARAGAGANTRDEITAQAARAALVADGQVRGVNYNVEVTNGVAYLLGIAASAEELERAAGTVARVNGVERVVTYVRIAGQS